MDVQMKKYIKQSLFVIGIGAWLYGLIAYAIPMTNKALLGFESNEYPFTGDVTCTRKNAEAFSFSTKDSISISRSGAFGRGDPFIVVRNKGGERTLNYEDKWHCHDENGKSAALFEVSTSEQSVVKG